MDAAAGSEGSGGRQWQVVTTPNGFLREEPKLTPYGWLVRDVQFQGRNFTLEFMAQARERTFRPYAAYIHAGLKDVPELRILSSDGGAARLAAVGTPAGLFWQVPDHVYTVTAAKLFRLPGNKQPDAAYGKQFLNVWNAAGLVPAGNRLRNSPDVNDIVTFTDTAVEVRVPVELPMESKKADLAARGRVVVVCTDAALLAELKQLRASADPAAGVTTPPKPPMLQRALPWRVDRIESDMRPEQSRDAETGPGAPGGM